MKLKKRRENVKITDALQRAQQFKDFFKDEFDKEPSFEIKLMKPSMKLKSMDSLPNEAKKKKKKEKKDLEEKVHEDLECLERERKMKKAA